MSLELKVRLKEIKMQFQVSKEVHWEDDIKFKNIKYKKKQNFIRKIHIIILMMIKSNYRNKLLIKHV